MRQMKFSVLQEYVQWLIKQYHAMQAQNQQDAYRIVNKEVSADGECHLTVQIIERSNF